MDRKQSLFSLLLKRYPEQGRCQSNCGEEVKEHIQRSLSNLTISKPEELIYVDEHKSENKVMSKRMVT